jgi:hypothetical protein
LTALTTDFERESAFDHAFDRAADVQWQRHHRRDAVEKKNPLGTSECFISAIDCLLMYRESW